MSILKLIWFFAIFTLIINCNIKAQKTQSDILIDNQNYRNNMNKEFADTAESPLTKEGITKFKKIRFYPIKTKFRVVAKLVLTPNEQAFEMPRSKGNTGTYRKYGEATFVLNGKEFTLSVYQYMKLINDEQYKNDLFLPFKDLTNGKQTYGGGRFLELQKPTGEALVIDFNKAYNPLCCYHNPKYSCPIPPLENHLQVKINAGEKRYKYPK